MVAVDVFAARFVRANRLYLDLVDALSSDQLGSRLADLPSNTIGGQLWCVLGARESYPRATRRARLSACWSRRWRPWRRAP